MHCGMIGPLVVGPGWFIWPGENRRRGGSTGGRASRMRNEMCEEQTGTLESPRASLFYRIWKGAGASRGVVLLVHGLGEHSGRYRHVGGFLADHSLTVVAYDQRGHGLSSGETGLVERFSDFLDDLEWVVARVREWFPSLPLVLLGHSMGGLIVTAYVLEKPERPDFLVLSGPAIVPILDPSDRTIDPTRLSRDPAVWKAYLEDPLVLRERVRDELFERLADGLALLPGRAGEIDVPCLLIHGGDDALCSAEGARAYVEAMAGSDRTVLIYPGGRHEMFNEINREEVLEDLWEWIAQRLPARSVAATGDGS